MTAVEIAAATVGGIIILVGAGLPIGIALISCSIAGVLLINGDLVLAGKLLSSAATSGIEDNLFSVVPLFILMGVLVSISGIGAQAFEVAEAVMRRVTGGLGIATVAANAFFAAVTGVSVASLAVFSKIAVPEMRRHGYSKRFATGVVAGSSVLGMLIPPSLLFIVYGLLTDTSIGRLFMAGIVPGTILVLVFAALILLMARYRPPMVFDRQAPGPLRSDQGPAALFIKAIPILSLGAIVSVGIYAGFFTTIEAAGVAAAAAACFAVGMRRLDLKSTGRVLIETGHVTASLFVIFIGASMYTRMLAMSGLPNEIGALFAHVPFGLTGAIVVYILIVLMLGCILDSISILLIMVPLAFPVIQAQGGDAVWFGVVSVIAIEVGLLTPPVGLSAFVLKSSIDDSDISLKDIFIGSAPFALGMVVLLVLLIAFPQLPHLLVPVR